MSHLGVVMKLHVGLFQVADHGKDHGFILVVPGEPKGAEIGQPAHMVNEPLDVELHL